MKRSLGSTAAAACVAVLAACGSDDDSAAPASTYTAARDTVAVTGGTVAASADSSASLRVFKALPFAAPPVVALRWKAPQPVVAWNGIRRNDSFAPACLMGNRPAGAIGAILYQDSEPQSEDCLYLNVWTGAAPGAADKRPVMLLLHGGGYLLGSGAQPNYDGGGLASKGAVVVTLNYRLGALGFLAHPELSAESPNCASGNYALHDAIAALQWIKARRSELRRRSSQRHRLQRIGGRRAGERALRFAAGRGPVPPAGDRKPRRLAGQHLQHDAGAS